MDIPPIDRMIGHYYQSLLDWEQKESIRQSKHQHSRSRCNPASILKLGTEMVQPCASSLSDKIKEKETWHSFCLRLLLRCYSFSDLVTTHFVFINFYPCQIFPLLSRPRPKLKYKYWMQNLELWRDLQRYPSARFVRRASLRIESRRQSNLLKVCRDRWTSKKRERHEKKGLDWRTDFTPLYNR